MASKPTLLIDFDAVLHRYVGWEGPEKLNGPIDKARHAMLLLQKDFRLICFTTRPAEPVEKWLRHHGFPPMTVTNQKLPAFLIIDDRVLRFDGLWTDEFLQLIRNFKPYWQLTPTSTDVSTPEKSG